MGKRFRIAIVVGVVVGLLGGAFYQAWQRRPSAVHEFEWGRNLSGGGVLNVVTRVDAFDAERGRFSYYTGARSGDSGPRVPAPKRVLARAVHGSISVRLLGFGGDERTGAAREADEMARIISSATTHVFPAAAIPVEIDVHVMPEGARFSLAKRVDWHEGRPYELAIFTREWEAAGTAAHELYHVLALRWSLRDAAEAARRPGAASSYEEAAAELYAACGELLTNTTLPQPEPSKARLTIVDPALRDPMFEGTLAVDELVAALEVLRTGANGDGFRGFGPLLAATVFEHVFGGAAAIALDSPQGARLLALCSAASADPFAIEAWLAATTPVPDAATASPEARAPSEPTARR
jgi:hypothetical protein